MFPAEPWRPDVWISFPFLAWDLEIYPRTHMWFFNQLWCTRACACISNLNYAPSQNHEPSWEKLRFARSLYQNLFLFGQFFYHNMVVPWHDIHAKFHDFQMCFGFTRILKPSFSMFSAEPRCPDVWISFPFLAWDLEIHPRTQMWFSNQLWCTGACACSSNLNYAH